MLARFAALIALSATYACAQDQAKFFETTIRPLLANHCYGCHSAKSKIVFGGLRVDSREHFFQGGQSGALVVPGKPDESRLMQVVNYSGALKMPPAGKLPPEQIEQLAEWIRMGAPWPEEHSKTHENDVKNAEKRA